MTAEEIMNRDAEWKTWRRTASDCYDAIYPVTDLADWWESLVLGEDTLRAQDIMREAIKGSRRIKSQK